MNENRRDIGSDLAKVDAHVITPEEYEEIPEITDDMWARGVSSHGDADLDRAVATLLSANLPLDQDVAAGLRQSGDDWERRGNAVLRDWLKSRAA